MRRVLIVIGLLLLPAMAQRLEVSAGSPYGLNLGIRTTLLPLIDLRLYGGGYPLSGSFVFGGGADVLASIPLTDFYAGAGGFYGNGPTVSGVNQGTAGARAVLGTNFGLGLIGAILPASIFAELHPMAFFPSAGMLFGIGGSVGVSFKLP